MKTFSNAFKPDCFFFFICLFYFVKRKGISKLWNQNTDVADFSSSLQVCFTTVEQCFQTEGRWSFWNITSIAVSSSSHTKSSFFTSKHMCCCQTTPYLNNYMAILYKWGGKCSRLGYVTLVYKTLLIWNKEVAQKMVKHYREL